MFIAAAFAVFAVAELKPLSSSCVEFTTVCAPAGESIEQNINGVYGGRATMRSSTTITLWGASFASPVTIDVNPRSDRSGQADATVHITGALAAPVVIGGIAVDGVVTLGRQGRDADIVVTDATTTAQSTTSWLGVAVDLPAHTRVEGRVDALGGTVQFGGAVVVDAIAFTDVGVHLQVRSDGLDVRGVAATATRVGGVDVKAGPLAVRRQGTTTSIQSATLASPTSLELLGLPPGRAPAGADVALGSGESRITTADVVEVCGLALRAPPTPKSPIPQPPPAVVFAPSSFMAVSGLADPAVVVDGVSYAGVVVISFDRAAPCTVVGVNGKATRSSTHLDAVFAAGPRNWSRVAGREFVSGALARAQTIGGWPVQGDVTLSREAGGAVVVASGTLAAAAEIEHWRVPAGSRVQRFGDGWEFTTPKGQTARALSPLDGTRVDGVRIGRRDSQEGYVFVTADPVVVAGIALSSPAWNHGAVVGGAARAHDVNGVRFPRDASVTICHGRIQHVDAPGSVQVVRVGDLYATEIVAGPRAARPDDDACDVAVEGWWLQINSLCRGASGIPLPPPPEQWVFVDGAGHVVDETPALAARLKYAKKPGTPCPDVPCCVP